MKLSDVIKVMGSGEWLRIGTYEGDGWMIYDRTIHVDEHELYGILKDREVLNIYSVESREGSPRCQPLDSGIAVIVEGEECGAI